MILRAISSLMATRDSLTFTMTFPFRLETIGDCIACHKAQILQMLFDLRIASDLADDTLFARRCECKRHQILRPPVSDLKCLITIKGC